MLPRLLCEGMKRLGKTTSERLVKQKMPIKIKAPVEDYDDDGLRDVDLFPIQIA